ncbi:hypothetical protein [Lentzea jiangxiensis]|uniref:Ig-like domain-containing protein n=1 Tax=Lentzea jiangxiensis TaxID=641025 RepID=A0A1H0VQ06_9PSEU|nr:hypothetical protein [Lentzea jiangxiensis]SDP80265.1 hypothetical protein SAMN05421507_11541 [Lentzea jiangxiensis]
MRATRAVGLLSMARRFLTGAVVALTVAAGVVVTAPTAQAATELLSCVGSGANTYNPGVTAQPKVVSITSSADYDSCVSTGSPAITSGGFAIVANGLVSCLGGGVSITVTITWNTGETTTVAAVGLVVLRPANEVVVIYQGTVTAGRFTGATVVMTAALLNTTPAQCFTPEGVTGTSGPANITITQLA